VIFVILLAREFLGRYCLAEEFPDYRYLRYVSGSIIPLGNREMIGNFSEVTIFISSKFAPVWMFDFDLKSQKF
jgi:hypothetical protein